MTTNSLKAANQNDNAFAQTLNAAGLYVEIDRAFPEDLTPGERAAVTADAKAHYEELFPETKVGVRQGLGAKRVHGLTSGQSPAPAFVTVVVERAKGRRGWSESSIKQVVLRGEYIRRDVLDAVINDGLYDTGTKLDKLAGLAKHHQMREYLSWKSGQPPTPPAPALPLPTSDWWRGRAGVIERADRFCIPGVVDLHLGKSEKVLPVLFEEGVRVNLIASDVPYGINYKDGAIPNDQDAVKTSGWAVPLMLSLLNDDSFAFICTRWDVAPIWTQQHVRCGAPICGRIVWDKKGPNGRPAPFVSRTEDILVARKGHPALLEWVNESVPDFGDETIHMALGFEDKELGRVVKADVDLWPIPVPRANGAGDEHDTRKPVAMGIRMILNGSAEGDVVLDAFMGSGPFAVAAILTGRAFIGVEQEAPHFAEAVRRVKAALRHIGSRVKTADERLAA